MLPITISKSFSALFSSLRFKISPCFEPNVLKRRGAKEQSNEEIRKKLKVSGTSLGLANLLWAYDRTRLVPQIAIANKALLLIVRFENRG